MPETSATDFLKQAAQDILTLFHNKQEYLPTLAAGDETLLALQQIAELLHRNDEKPPPLPESPP